VGKKDWAGTRKGRNFHPSGDREGFEEEEQLMLKTPT